VEKTGKRGANDRQGGSKKTGMGASKEKQANGSKKYRQEGVKRQKGL
jgi:hypothetical protein